MTAPDIKIKTTDHFGDPLYSNQLELCLKSFFEWGFMSIGGWTNVTAGSSPGAYGGDYSVLRRVDDPSYTAGTVYEGFRKDWCWETGIDYVDKTSTTRNPTSPASVFVDGSPTTPSYINYPLGRVVFSSAISSSAVVTATYSFRNVQIYIADAVPWWQQLQYRSFRVDDNLFSQTSDGIWAIGSHHRIQMPAVIVEAVPRAVSRPYQLGDGSAWVEQDVIFHVMGETRWDRNQIVDVLRGQFDNQIFLFDSEAASLAGDFPLDEYGDISDASKHYMGLVDDVTGYRDKNIRFIRTQTAQIDSINERLYQGAVRITCEVILTV